MSVQDLINKVTALFQASAAKNVQEYIPLDRTDYHPETAEAYYYFQVYLAEMFLAEGRSWGINIYPAVHGSVKMEANGSSTQYSRVTQAPDSALARGVQINYPLTPLLPYSSGTVEIDTSLLGLKGPNSIKTFLKVLEGFSGLVAPPLQQALKVADLISNGVLEMINSGNADVVLHYHDTLSENTAANPLRPTYIAVIASDRIESVNLTVHNHQLHLRKGNQMEPLTGCDYMLLRIEAWENRDWEKIPEIVNPFDQAMRAYRQNKPELAAVHEGAAIDAAYTSDALARHDRVRAVAAITQALEPFKSGSRGAAAQQPLTLNQARDLISIEEARGMEERSLEAVMQLLQ